MTIQEAKDNLLKEIITPDGKMILYGINLIPNSDAMGLIFYKGNRQVMFFSIDCSVVVSGNDTDFYTDLTKWIE